MFSLISFYRSCVASSFPSWYLVSFWNTVWTSSSVLWEIHIADIEGYWIIVRAIVPSLVHWFQIVTQLPNLAVSELKISRGFQLPAQVLVSICERVAIWADVPFLSSGLCDTFKTTVSLRCSTYVWFIWVSMHVRLFNNEAALHGWSEVKMFYTVNEMMA